VVNVKLTDVDWLEVTVLAVIFLMDCVWVNRFISGFDVDGLALVSTAKGYCFGVSKFDSNRTTD